MFPGVAHRKYQARAVWQEIVLTEASEQSQGKEGYRLTGLSITPLARLSIPGARVAGLPENGVSSLRSRNDGAEIAVGGNTCIMISLLDN